MPSTTLTLHHATFTTGGHTRPVEIAVVRRKRSSGQTTQVRVVDAGAATLSTAGRIARQLAGDGDVVRRTVDRGDLGDFAPTDEGRDAMLAAVRAWDLGLGRITESSGMIWSGSAPLRVKREAT